MASAHGFQGEYWGHDVDWGVIGEPEWQPSLDEPYRGTVSQILRSSDRHAARLRLSAYDWKMFGRHRPVYETMRNLATPSMALSAPDVFSRDGNYYYSQVSAISLASRRHQGSGLRPWISRVRGILAGQRVTGGSQ